MTLDLKVKYENECLFTVYYGDQDVAWCQWSPVYEMWRVIMLSDNHVHHLENVEQIFRVCSDEIGVDFE